MTEYDSKVLYEFANRLYNRAAWIAWGYAFLAGLLGFFGGGAAAAAVGSRDNVVMAGVVLAVLFAAIGYSAGREKGFALRLQAQTALCQAQIEANTRARAS